MSAVCFYQHISDLLAPRLCAGILAIGATSCRGSSWISEPRSTWWSNSWVKLRLYDLRLALRGWLLVSNDIKICSGFASSVGLDLHTLLAQLWGVDCVS